MRFQTQNKVAVLCTSLEWTFSIGLPGYLFCHVDVACDSERGRRQWLRGASMGVWTMDVILFITLASALACALNWVAGISIPVTFFVTFALLLSYSQHWLPWQPPMPRGSQPES
jgi:dolichyl-phosphate-mannose--protein O-mannosyl transferase